ncbi:hypothetical protein, partial [Stenotrophomonas sp. P5_B8]
WIHGVSRELTHPRPATPQAATCSRSQLRSPFTPPVDTRKKHKKNGDAFAPPHLYRSIIPSRYRM